MTIHPADLNQLTAGSDARKTGASTRRGRPPKTMRDVADRLCANAADAGAPSLSDNPTMTEMRDYAFALLLRIGAAMRAELRRGGSRAQTVAVLTDAHELAENLVRGIDRTAKK